MDFENSQWNRINRAIENNPAVPTIPDSTELTAAGVVTENPKLTAPIKLTAHNELPTNITTVKTNSATTKNLSDHDHTKDNDKIEVDSASSDEDHETENIKPVNSINEAERSINLRSGTKIMPSSTKRVRFRLNPSKK
jgi:hypothetical protein